MRSTLVAVIDASVARLFALDKNESEGTSELSLLAELEQPDRRELPSETFSDTRPGTRRAVGTGHALDDHRTAHVAEHDRSFARDIALDLAQRAADPAIASLIVAASPKMLGLLRPELDDALRDEVAVRDIPVDVARRTPVEIHDYLCAKDLLPPRGRVQ